jgi:molybdopterin molybdotransferase
MKTLEQIGAELQGYDPNALRADDVVAFLARMVEPLREAVTLPLMSALGRVLAHDIVSPISVPPHDNSAMDGYALNGADLATGREGRFRVVGTALAGKAWQGRLASGDCVKIMTGAIMPGGTDTVAPKEVVRLVDGAAAGAGSGEFIALPPGVLRPGDNRRLLGEDLRAGSPAVRQGSLLTPAALGLVASLGLATVAVVRQLKVAYFSTGDEILSLGDPAREGAVYDSNRYTVFGLLTRLGCAVIDLGVVPDDPALLEAAFRDAAARADAVITSGGVSVGEADHTKAMMKKLAGDGQGPGGVAFWRIAMRPGRPMAVGRIQAPDGRLAVLFGLPGNPVAVMVTFLAFVRPTLLRMMGARVLAPPLLRARSLEAMRKKPGRTEYQRGVVSVAAGGTGLEVCTTGNQGSGVLSSMVQANGLVVLHHDQGDVAVGDEVDVMMFEGTI